MSDDAERAGYVVQQLGHVLAELAQGPATFEARTGAVTGCGMLDDVAR
jgi:hypothetical protein